MTFRIGQCSSCGASYKLPATFQADQARCKNCSGVVNIGKVGDAAPPAATAPPVPAAKPSEASAPKKNRSGPSMKERIQAQRRAEAEAAQAKATPAAEAAPKVVKKTASAVKPVGVKAPAGKAAGAKPVSRTSGTRSKRAAAGDEEGDKAGGRRRRGAPQKKKSPVAGIVGLLVLVGAIGAVAVMMNQDNGPAEGDVKAADGKTAAAESTESAGETSVAGAEISSESSDAAPANSDAVVLKDAAAPAKAEESAEAKEARVAAEAAEDKAKHDPSNVDLSEIADFPPFKTTSKERFEELKELVAVMLDPEAGAAGNRARGKLVEAGREAMPVIINAMKTLDLANDEQFRSADVSQKTLEEICNGNNLGWKYPSQEPERFHLFDKKVIQSWAREWTKCIDNDEAWMKLAKLDKLPDAKESTSDGDDEDMMGADF